MCCRKCPDRPGFLLGRDNRNEVRTLDKGFLWRGGSGRDRSKVLAVVLDSQRITRQSHMCNWRKLGTEKVKWDLPQFFWDLSTKYLSFHSEDMGDLGKITKDRGQGCEYTLRPRKAGFSRQDPRDSSMKKSAARLTLGSRDPLMRWGSSGLQKRDQGPGVRPLP